MFVNTTNTNSFRLFDVTLSFLYITRTSGDRTYVCRTPCDKSLGTPFSQFVPCKVWLRLLTRNSAIADKPCDAIRGQVKVTKPAAVPFVRYGFPIVTLSLLSLGYSTSKCCDLENRVRGPWRSLNMSPFDRDLMTSCWCCIVTMALSPVDSEIINV